MYAKGVDSLCCKARETVGDDSAEGPLPREPSEVSVLSLVTMKVLTDVSPVKLREVSVLSLVTVKLLTDVSPVT